MDKKKKICLVGEVLVDVTLTPAIYENKLRFGGIFHAARTLWALGIDFEIFYIAPDYLTEQITNYAQQHGAKMAVKIGSVNGAPNLIIIGDATESGDQGYDLILRDEYCCKYNNEAMQEIQNRLFTDIFIFPGNYKLEEVLRQCCHLESKIHIDIAYNVEDLKPLEILQKKFDSIFLSTSSKLFLEDYEASLELIKPDILSKYCNIFVFKENRGGARVFINSEAKNPIFIESQTRPISHSVGVGDCFNLSYIALADLHPIKAAFYYASWIAAEYASTTYVDDFKKGCERIIKIDADTIVQIPGISLPWEQRQGFNIYIAAPDFDYMDRTEIDSIVDKLHYHNFSPRLPIREHGQMSPNATLQEKQNLFDKDISLIEECHLVLAVLIDNDTGTYIEIGLAAGLNIPVIVYDPYRLAKNLMLTQLPKLVTSNIDSIIAEIFCIASKERDDS